MKKNKTTIICNNKKNIYRLKIKNKDRLFEYLKAKGFNNYLPIESETDKYEIYRFITEDKISEQEKAQELIKTISFLHISTTTYQEVNIDVIKEMYEKIKEEITNLKIYYYDLQDYIETKIYMSPAEQLLMNNISNFHKALNYAEYKLNDWYNSKKQEKIERQVLLHNDISLKHFFIEGNNSYIIDWEKSSKGIVVYDFIQFYKNEFLHLEMISLFNNYQTKYKYTKSEMLLFETLISIPPKIEFKNTNLINTINTRKQVNYVIKTNLFLLEYNKENQECNKEEFKQ